MIAILVPRLGQSSEVFIDRHIYGLAELKPIVFTLGLGERRVEVPTVTLSPHTLPSVILSRLLNRCSYFWNKRIMCRPYVWEAKSFGAGRRLAQYLKRPDIDVVVVHFANMGTSFVSQLERLKVPLVVICHGSEIHSAEGHKPYLKKLTRLFARADKVLCVSQYIMNKVVGYGCAPSKAEVFFLGVELPNIGHQNRHVKGPVRYVMTARLHPVKDHSTLLHAFARVCHEIKDAELLLIGDGVLHDELELLAQQFDISNNVKFLGFQSSRTVYQELTNASVYVHVSHKEALGIAIVEAMAACLPVVATAVGGIPEIVEDGNTGFLVPPGDINKLTEKMLLLGKNLTLRHEMGREGRQVVEQKFDVHKQNSYCVELLRELMKA